MTNLLGLDFVLMFFLSAIMSIAGVEEIENEVEGLLDDPMLLVVMAVVFAPLIEEAVFRLPMRYSGLNILLPFVLIILSIPAIFTTMTSGIIIALLVSTGLLFYFINQKTGGMLADYADSTWEEKFPILFWFLTVGFAALHLTNFASSFPLYLAPIMVLPQLVLGIILGYLRVGWGFWYGVFFHALHNGIFVGLATLAKASGIE